MDNNKKKQIDYDIEEILAEFSDGEKGLSSLAEKYRVPLGKTPNLPRRQTAGAPAAPTAPGNHRVVYEDASGATRAPDARQSPPALPAQKPQERVRVVYDADAPATSEAGGFHSFDSVTADMPSGIPVSAPAKSPAPKAAPAPKSTPAAAVSAPASKTSPRPQSTGYVDDFEDISDELLAVGNPQKSKAAGKKEPALKRFLFTFLPRKGDGGAESLRKVIMTLSLFVIIGVIGYFINHYMQSPGSNPPLVTEVSTDASGNYVDPRKEFPGITFPQGLLDQFVPLYAQNQDFVGWINLPGKNSIIGLPVVQEKGAAPGEDNFYVTHGFDKKPTIYGTPVLDVRNKDDASDTNAIIGAHNMNDGTQFGQLSDYLDIETFRKHPVLSYWTRTTEYKYVIYAAFITNAEHNEDNGYRFNFHTPVIASAESFAGFKRMLDLKTLYRTGVDLEYGDKLLTLYTCGYAREFHEARYVVVARRLRPGETEASFDVSKAEWNPNPMYPQAWYTKRGKTNPYKDVEKWYPS